LKIAFLTYVFFPKNTWKNMSLILVVVVNYHSVFSEAVNYRRLQLHLSAVSDKASIMILRVLVGKKSRLIRNATELCKSSVCIFIEAFVKFRSILIKSQFILIFRSNRAKSQFFSKCAFRKVTQRLNFFTIFCRHV